MLSLHTLLPELIALGQVILMDLVLAGDNAIVVGMAAAGLAKEQRGKAILVGIIVATVLRIVFAIAANKLLLIIGLTLAGGILLLWVCWKFWRELMLERRERLQHAARERALSRDEHIELSEPPEVLPGAVPGKTMRQAITQIVVADVSMSLDNVLAVAGAAREHTWVLVFGLVLSVGLMGAAASLIARILKRYHWIAYIGLGVIFYVACQMIWDGWHEVARHMPDMPAFN
ncbi:MAG TPA: TerC family protein [Dongiaceae bacterium]|nr:TerC family protein [Dongiaceae bacterium]